MSRVKSACLLNVHVTSVTKCFWNLIKLDRKSRSCLLYFITSVLLHVCYHTVLLSIPANLGYKSTRHVYMYMYMCIVGSFLCKYDVRHNGIAHLMYTKLICTTRISVLYIVSMYRFTRLSIWGLFSQIYSFIIYTKIPTVTYCRVKS